MEEQQEKSAKRIKVENNSSNAAAADDKENTNAAAAVYQYQRPAPSQHIPDSFASMLRNGTMMEFAAAAKRDSAASSTPSIRSYSEHYSSSMPEAHHAYKKKPQDMRIVEVLAANFETQLSTSSSTSSSFRNMEGDIPTLCLHNSFFVEGVRIGWPFPAIMPPQRQMALHLIKALKNRRHVVLESPTGTGKSAAILCSVLAWQRWHGKLTKTSSTTSTSSSSTPRIIYCSRTHSQVAQMIQSLRKTPYRPRMAVLGSRERLCIHRKIQNRGTVVEEESDTTNNNRRKKKNSTNVNQECRVRVGNTEEMRKRLLKSTQKHNAYNDEDPPESTERDNVDAPPPPEDADATEWIESRQSKKPCCPHYRQLTTSRVASLAHQQFVPQPQQVSCCSVGGEKTKLGTHDIEDLVQFGMDPHVRRGVAIYRKPEETSFGMTLSSQPPSNGRNFHTKILIDSIKPDSAAAREGSLKAMDEIVRVNNRDIAGRNVTDVANELRQVAQEDPLLLDVTQDSAFVADETNYSTHSACPYYLSRELAKHAELVFAPYNYVLDPFIRKSLDIDLTNTIVVLDEAHNVEDTLREGGSGKFGEFELCEIIVMLARFSAAQRGKSNQVEVGGEREGEGETKDVSDVAHELLLFVEKLITFIMEAKTRFESSPGNSGARKALADWAKFHTPDETEFEITYDGPTGYGVHGKPVGCQSFFDKLGLTFGQSENLKHYIEALEAHIRAKESWEQEVYSNSLDKLNNLIVQFSFALEDPEHYYIASVARANGNLEYAAGMSGGGLRRERDNPFQRKPKSMPFIPPRSHDRPNALAELCLHKECRNVKSGPHYQEGSIRHGTYCNGATPPWEAVLVLELLSPARFMKDLAEQCHTVVLASGSLSPIPSLCGELGLRDEHTASELKAVKPEEAKSDSSKEPEKNAARLQTHPKPLEANHVIDLEKQLLAVSIGHFPDGSSLTVNYQNYSKPEFIPKLGGAIASVIEAIPTGGVLVFMPSYSFLRKCVKSWNPTRGQRGFSYFDEPSGSDTWERLIASKGKVIVEPTGSQAKFEEARDEYAETIRENGSCILLAVFRGKMSEGISFNDANARGVICLGVPFPNSYDRAVKAKKSYNDEQRRLQKRNDILPGNEWYSQQAYRAIGQALGRCIRHAADYGTVILMDSRHCDDGEPVEGVCHAHRSLPKWMRSHVRNLSRRTMGDAFGKSIAGGWNGLRNEMQRFFQQAPIHANAVLEQQQENFRRKREQDLAATHSFDRKTGDWTPKEQNAEPTPVSSAQDVSLGAQVTPTTQGTPVIVSSNKAVAIESNTAFDYGIDSEN